MATTQSSMVDRMIGAAMLDVATYEEVEHDQTATGQAAGVVALAAVARAVGALGDGAGVMIFGLVGAFVGWLIWSGVTYVIGDALFDAEATWGEVLRAVGFAQAPALLAVVGFIPLLGGLVELAVAIWVLVAGFIGLRQALDIDNAKTLVTVVLGWIAMMIVMVVPMMMFGMTMM